MLRLVVVAQQGLAHADGLLEVLRGLDVAAVGCAEPAPGRLRCPAGRPARRPPPPRRWPPRPRAAVGSRPPGRGENAQVEPPSGRGLDAFQGHLLQIRRASDVKAAASKPKGDPAHPDGQGRQRKHFLAHTAGPCEVSRPLWELRYGVASGPPWATAARAGAGSGNPAQARSSDTWQALEADPSCRLGSALAMTCH